MKPRSGTPRETICRTCGGRIYWVLTTSGKTIPLDAKPAADGNLRLDSGVTHYVPRGVAHTGPLYRIHFGACADALLKRKGKERASG
ncbi:MAG TPA: hypothetical protein VGJ84_23575 [Polyangiaceae bacterium]